MDSTEIEEARRPRACAVIPARLDSSRLPRKLLLDIGGTSAIRRTYRQVLRCRTIERVYVVTDSPEIYDDLANELRRDGFNGSSFILREEKCRNGTERICNALADIDERYDVVVNVQGDEPFIDPEIVDAAVSNYLLSRRSCKSSGRDVDNIACGTLHFEIEDDRDLADPSVVKLVLDRHNNVLYGSRAMIPSTPTGTRSPDIRYYGHIGVFVYDRRFLETWKTLGEGPCQTAEDIEWLKLIEHGHRIASACVDRRLYERSLNTPDDYLYLVAKYSVNGVREVGRNPSATAGPTDAEKSQNRPTDERSGGTADIEDVELVEVIERTGETEGVEGKESGDCYGIADQLETIRRRVSEIDSTQIDRVVDMIASSTLVVVACVGKNQAVAVHLAGLLNSLSVPSTVLSVTNARHGDLGMITRGSTVVYVSNSGDTAELLELAPDVAKKGPRTATLCSNPRTRLAGYSDAVVVLPKVEEADAYRMMPTTSIALYVMVASEIARRVQMRLKPSIESYFENHPAGAIGTALSSLVENLQARPTDDAVETTFPKS